MQRLVGDILELARFRSGSIRLQLRRFDACELARAVAASVEPLARARGQDVVVRGCDGNVALFGDHRRIEQALLNLVSNAQRFSPDGATIDVTVAVVEARVQWTVRDAGPGIPESDRGRLFERFFVGRSDRHAAGEGVGLGLPTALAIAQAHGGTIDVDSEVGRGSTFTLVVPVDGPGEQD
jgi:signal transduction histidine kinase